MARGKKSATTKKPKAAKAPQSEISQALFNEFAAEYSAKRQAVDDANSALRGTVKRAKAAGVNTAMLIQARAEQRMDPDKLRADIRALETYRSWMGLPTGTQSEMFPDVKAPANDPALTQEERVRRAGESGLEAGKAGHARDTNPHPAGSEEYQSFDRCWVQGQETIAEKMTRRGRAPTTGVEGHA